MEKSVGWCLAAPGLPERIQGVGGVLNGLLFRHLGLPSKDRALPLCCFRRQSLRNLRQSYGVSALQVFFISQN